jgi:linoleoyl-CoA desaturase
MSILEQTELESLDVQLAEPSSTFSSMAQALRLSVAEIKRARRRLHAKTAFTWSLAAVSYVVLVVSSLGFVPKVVAAVLLTHALVAIATGIMHDANHGSFSAKRRVNAFVAYSADLLGASSLLWRQQHNVMHHRHTNIEGVDGDIDQMPFARLSASQPLHKIHRYQHVYMWFLYGFLTIRWFLVGDFLSAAQYKKNPLTSKAVTKAGVLKMFTGKAVHASWALVVPFFFSPWWSVLLTYMVISYSVGFVLAVTFQVAHCVAEADFIAADPGVLKGNAMITHQLNTTVDVIPGNIFARAYIGYISGGLQFQVEHHIQPRTPHTAYPLLSAKVRALCEQRGITYRTHNGVWSAIRAHGRYLKLMGQPA